MRRVCPGIVVFALCCSKHQAGFIFHASLLSLIDLRRQDLFFKMTFEYRLIWIPSQRPAGSIGLVVDDQLDAFDWYCFECGALVHRIEVKVTHLVNYLPPLYEAFFNDEKARTCKKCGALHPGKKPPPGWANIEA